MVNPNPNTEGLRPWKKGCSGNSKGTPGSKILTTLLAEIMDKEIDFNDPYIHKKLRIPIKEALVLRLVYLALRDEDKSVQAIKEIFDRLEGKAEQSMKIEGDFQQQLPNVSTLTFQQLKELKYGTSNNGNGKPKPKRKPKSKRKKSS